MNSRYWPWRGVKGDSMLCGAVRRLTWRSPALRGFIAQRPVDRRVMPFCHQRSHAGLVAETEHLVAAVAEEGIVPSGFQRRPDLPVVLEGVVNPACGGGKPANGHHTPNDFTLATEEH